MEAGMRKELAFHAGKEHFPVAILRGVKSLWVLLIAGTILLCAGAALAASAPEQAPPRVVHVVVALCDNLNQGIVPVPKGIGNGQNPATNLYWGAAHGVKTFFSRQEEWTLVERLPAPEPRVQERLVFRLKGQNLYMVADAWDGKEIKPAIETFLEYAAGGRPETITLTPPSTAGMSGTATRSAQASDTPSELRVGGQAGLVVYIGHNGLMDFSLDSFPQAAGPGTRDAAVFACLSRDYFLEALQQAGARPLILTKSLMCPEAYSTHALILGWAKGEDPAAIRERVAAIYGRYQKCSLKAARSVFAAGE